MGGIRREGGKAMADRKRVLVSGASSGIGAAAAVRFAAEGWDVCLLARRKELLERVRAGLKPGDHQCWGGDYSEPATAAAAARLVAEKWGKLDCLVNCAGMFLAADCIGGSVDEWRKPFDSIVNGAVLLTRALVPQMSDGGRVIHVTSIHHERAERGAGAYSMAKAAINQYCRALALELAPRGILVNAIAPGFVDTPMSIGPDGKSELESEWFRTNYVDGHHLPLRRAGKPEEVAGVAYFLAGPDASYMTGQVLTVDGGLTITF